MNHDLRAQIRKSPDAGLGGRPADDRQPRRQVAGGRNDQLARSIFGYGRHQQARAGQACVREHLRIGCVSVQRARSHPVQRVDAFDV